MKFRRWPSIEAFGDTPRKRAAFHRKMRLEREKYPLFAEWIEAGQPHVDSVMADRAVAWARVQAEMRQQRAAKWREARARLQSYGDNQRGVIRQLWQEAPYPADPVYLLDMLTQIDRGRIDIDQPPWRFTADEIAAMQRFRERFGVQA